MYSNPASVVNAALHRIGYADEVGYLLEGSPAARVALAVYGQTRDALLRSKDWPFARQSVAMTLLKTAPVGGYNFATPWTTAYPPIPWIWEYSYPVSCLEMRSVRPQPFIIPEYDPVPNIFVIADDYSLAPPAKVVLTNLADAIGVFTGQVTDPTQWEPMFTEALVEALARRFGEALGGNAESVKLQLEVEQATAAAADLVRG